MTDEAPPGPVVPGLTNPRSLGLQRFPIRTREIGATLSAWRLAVSSDEGEGVIVRIDSAGEPLFRGEGIFLGWDQERLASAYGVLQAESDAPPFEIPQLG